MNNVSLKAFKKKLEEANSQLNELIGEPVAEKLYRSLKMVNGVLTIVTNNGELLCKTNATAEDFLNVKAATTEADIIKCLYSAPVDTKEEKKQQEQDEYVKAYAVSSDILKQLRDFEFKDNAFYMTGTGRTIPELLIRDFVKVIAPYVEGNTAEQVEECLKDDDHYQALKNFFLWCCLNPRAEVADMLYDFLARNEMRITKQGFFVALRNVVTVKEDTSLVDFVSNAYNKVKAVWKKKPSAYWINYKREMNDEMEITGHSKELMLVKDDIHELNLDGCVGNLQELYDSLPDMEENRYTDDYTRTFDIRIGRVVNMPPEECSWSTRSCAEAGLHFAGYTAPYVLCGNTTVFTLHNPMKVVGIGSEKGRCWEYLPFMTTTVEEADEIMNSGDFDFLELDEKYAIQELENLAEKVKDGFTKEAKKHEFNIPSMSTNNIKSIVNSLELMKNVISKRVEKL